MKKCKITVLKTTLDNELAAEYGVENLGVCPMLKEGQIFYADYAKPQGFEQICGPGNLPSNIAQGAASLAVACKTKKSERKQAALTSGVTAVLGVTEPALFSITLKFKKVLAASYSTFGILFKRESN